MGLSAPRGSAVTPRARSGQRLDARSGEPGVQFPQAVPAHPEAALVLREVPDSGRGAVRLAGRDFKCVADVPFFREGPREPLA